MTTEMLKKMSPEELAKLFDIFAANRPGASRAEIEQAVERSIATVLHGNGAHRRAAMDDAARDRLVLAPDVRKPAGNGATPMVWRAHVITAAELQRKTFPPISYVVPGLIPEGLSILAGRPKVGKSWMALDVAIAVAAGRICLGERKPIEGDVLYCALEDNQRRLQRRIDKILGVHKIEWPSRLTLTTSWRRLDKGGVEDVAAWAGSVADPRLVILDTLAGVRPIRTRDGYTEDYESLAELHRMSNERGLGALVLHHTRKMDAEDPLDTISGTLGLAGCADTALVVTRSSNGTTLYVRGRDIEEAEHAVNFDKHSCRWTILGSAAEVHRSNERGKILTTLLEATELLGPQQIAERTSMKPDNVRYLLGQMVAAGEVIKTGRGRYHHPSRADLGETPSQASQPHNGEKTQENQGSDGRCEGVSDVRATPRIHEQAAAGKPEHRRCVHCGRSTGDAASFTTIAVDGEMIHLHRRCVRLWRLGQHAAEAGEG